MDVSSNTIDEYIAKYPVDVQAYLQELRSIVKSVTPYATEAIRYNMPAFLVNGDYLLYFAAWKDHVSLYPFTLEMATALPEARKFKTSGKGTIQFSLSDSLPTKLIKQILAIQLKKIGQSAKS